MMASWTIWVAGCAVLLSYLANSIRKVVNHRRLVRKFPGPNGHSMIWGHAKALSELASSRRHWDYTFANIAQEIDQDMYYLDVYPFDNKLILVADPEVAEKITHELPKSPTYDLFWHIVGAHSLISINGEEWKRLRKTFNPWFSPKKLVETGLQGMCDETLIFVQNLENLASKGETFAFQDYAKALTIDIIARTTLDVELNTQRSPSLPVRLFNELAYITSLIEGPLNRNHFNPCVQWRRYKACKDLDSWLHVQIRSHLHNAEHGGKPRDIIDLAVQNFGQSLSVEEYSDAAKTFLFAGFDTTSTMLSWLYYLLTQHPEVMRKLKDEHERVFGSDGAATKDICAQLLESPGKLNELKYTVQCMKETLRLYPPGSTGRMCRDPNYTIRYRGLDYPASKFVLYVNHFWLHRNPKWWGPDADRFDPGRFAEGKEIPLAYQPFSKVPRSCIGQDFAFMEGRIILALTLRKFDFHPTYEGTPYQLKAFTARPVDGMPMRVTLSS